jgi:hypothetical protein
MLTAALATAAALLTSVQDVFPRGDAHSELRQVHPVTLAPSGSPVRLEGFLMGGWARSPDRGRLALSVSDRGRVQIVSGRRSRVVRTGRRTAWWLLGWPRARRVVGLGYREQTSTPMVVVDPVAGRVLRSARVNGIVVAGVATADGLALVVAPPGRLADAELALVDAAGNERRYPLPGVPAGFVPPDADGNAREITPGLAVRDSVAYIATDTRVLAVDLTNGARITHATARAAKGSEGNLRTITFVGPHQLAVSGEDRASETVRSIGLRVVDTRTWAVRRVAGGARGALPLPGGGLAAWPTNRGLALLDENGQRRRTVLRGRRLVQVQAAGRYVYAVAHEPKHRTYVVDFRSGRVVRTLPTAQPGRLLN